MKFIKSSIIGLWALVLPAIGATLPQLESRVACGNIANKVAIRRLYSPTGHDHFYTWDGLEEAQYWFDLGYTRESESAGHYFLSPEPGTVPFYRLYNSATITHLYTTSQALRDASLNANPAYVLEGNFADGLGVSGFVYLDGSCPQTVPLFWASSASLTDNLYTLNVTEYIAFVLNGYQANGIAAWIYPA